MKKHFYLMTVILLGIFSSASYAASQSFWAYGTDDSAIQPKYLSGNTTKSISINYALDSSWTNISAKLWLKAVDDSGYGHCSGNSCIDSNKWWKGQDTTEQALITKIEGISDNYASKEIDGFGWYDLDLNVTNFLLTDSDNKFTALLKASLCDDFWYKNAKLVIDYDLKPVPVPAAIWLFGSALFGLTGLKRKSTKTAVTA